MINKNKWYKQREKSTKEVRRDQKHSVLELLNGDSYFSYLEYLTSADSVFF